MKFAIYILCFLMLLTGCAEKTESGTAEYEFSMELYAPGNPQIFSNSPEVSEDKIVFCDQYGYLFGRSENAEGNVYVYDTVSGEEEIHPVFADRTYLYKNCLYYFEDRSFVRTDLETDGTETLYAASESGPCGFTSGGDGYVIFFESNGEYSDVTLYSYDIEKQSCSVAAKTNYMTSPFHTFKIRNGFFAYTEKQDGKYVMHGVDLKNSKDRVLFESDAEPSQVIYDGELLVWSDYRGTHCLRDGEEITVGGGDSDVDILGSRYIFYFEDFKVYVHDLADGKTVFSSEGYDGVELCEWFDLDSESGKAAFTVWDRNTAETLYPNWEHEEYPELIYILSFTEK